MTPMIAASTQLRSQTPLTNEQLMRVAPSIFQDHAHESRSNRYSLIPTITVLDNLRKQGFQPMFVAQGRTRVPGKADFTKHLIRLRHGSMVNVADEAMEVCIINSHDGTSAYQLFRGVLRLVCTNGLVCGDSFEIARVKHTGRVVDEVIEASFKVLEDSERIKDSMDQMKSLQLSAPESNIFADTAISLRYPSDENEPAKAPPVQATQVLRSRRSADSGSDVWSTFNRVQENLVQGGLRAATTPTGRRSHTRGVNGISENTNLNRALWTLAERMAQLKTQQ